MKSLKVKMSDGVGLKTDIYFPGGQGPFPVILLRSTYGREIEDPVPWTEEGYVFIIQDVRGTGESEGEFQAFLSDGWGPSMHDGADTIRWAKSQPWCNGKVGTYGGSALGITQVLTAGASKAIDCQSIVMAASDLYTTLAYPGGVFRKCLWEAWMGAFGEGGLKTLKRYKGHPNKDEFWKYFDGEARAPEITAPGIHIGGWWDIFYHGTIRNFMCRQYHGGPGARGNQALIMAACTHAMNTEQDYRFKEKCEELNGWFKKESMAFFEYWLKGKGEPISRTRPVYYYVIGDDSDPEAPGNEWRSAEKWPPCPKYNRKFYLNPGGVLDGEYPIESGDLSFIYDPTNPFPTHGGANLVATSGPYDQRTVNEGKLDLSKYHDRVYNYPGFELPEGWEEEHRKEWAKERTDILKFETPVLSEPIEVTGPVKVRLHISSTAPDTDFTAKLVDIYPHGDEREIILLDNIQRVKYRDGFTSPAPLLKTGEVVEIEIDLSDTSCVFNRGHKIGLQISSSNYPRFERNPNTGQDFPEGDNFVKAKNTVHMGGVYPSALVMTVASGD